MTWHFWLKDRLTQTVSVWTSISQHLLWLKYHDNAERDPGSQDHMRWQSCGQILYKHLALTSCQTNVRSGRCETCWAQPQLQWAASWLFSTCVYIWVGVGRSHLQTHIRHHRSDGAWLERKGRSDGLLKTADSVSHVLPVTGMLCLAWVLPPAPNAP